MANWMSKAGLAATAGLLSAAAFAAPAQADPIDDAFLSALTGAGVNPGQSAEVLELGKSVCPMLTQPAGTFASTASSVTGAGGLSPEMAGLFTEIAVSVYCPQMMTQLANGELPSLPQIPGLTGGSGLPALSIISGLAGR